MKQDQLFNLVLAVHILAATLTYGHAYHSPSLATAKTYDGKIYEAHAASKASGAFLCGIFWPLYWSVHIMQPKEAK